MTITAESRTDERQRMRRARFYVSLVSQGVVCITGWPLDQDAAMVAIYASILRSGINSDVARRAIEISPLTSAWPAVTLVNGRACFTAEDVRDGLDYGDDGSCPEALDLLLAMGVQP